MSPDLTRRALALTDEAYQALKARHSALIRTAGAERFPLDRLVLEDDPPLTCEVERIGAALERVALHFSA